jgi:uncharacterized SAM-binding protein YcdF (DUF218 family)
MRFLLLENMFGVRSRAFLVFFAILFMIALYFAPYYLVFSQKPEKSDAVILIVGPDHRARFREAEQLVREGYAEYLIIPASNQVLRAESNRSLAKALSVSAPPAGAYETSETIENTHVEIAQARRIMDGLGFTSAIFVSSPYHMRRIKNIAKSVFLDTGNVHTFKLYFVPSRYETPRLNSWFLNIHDLRSVLMEYSKIFWFFIYSNFYRSTA